MKDFELEEKLKILGKLYKSEFLHPFPHQDCRKISSDENFVPSLDLYFSDIAGYCSWGIRIKKWDGEKIEIAKKQLQNSFFQRFVGFSELKLKINEKQTPQLFNQMLIYDLMRLTLLDILSEIKTNRMTQPMEISLVS